MPVKLNIPNLIRDWEKVKARLPEYPEGATSGNLALRSSQYAKGEIARFYDPGVGRFQYAKYPKAVTFASLVERRESDGMHITWMTSDQSEVSGMDAHAKAAYGDVLIAGLGLGVLPWLAAKNLNVRSVTVVEIRPEVIELIAPVIANQKTVIIQGDVWEHIDRHPETYDFIDLDLWPEVGAAVMSWQEVQKSCAKALKRGGQARTWLDELARRLTIGGALERICRVMDEDRGGKFTAPAINRNNPCEFCGTVEYVDCYRICFECCAMLALPAYIGGIVERRFFEFPQLFEAMLPAELKKGAGQ